MNKTLKVESASVRLPLKQRKLALSLRALSLRALSLSLRSDKSSDKR